MKKIAMTFILLVLAAAGIFYFLEVQKNKKLPMFQNPPGSPVVNKDENPEAWRKFFMERMFDKEQVVVPEDFVIPEADVLKNLAAQGDANSVTWLGHAAFLIRLDGLNILTDPWLSERASPFRWLLGPKRFSPPGISVQNLPKIDVLLISHNHYDHLDKETLHKLPNKDTMTVVTPLGNGRLLRPLGFKNVIELNWDESVSAKGIDVTVVPAIHFSARATYDRNRMLWGGFAVQGKTKKLYFSGDTTYGPAFKGMAKHGPFDLGMIGIGAYDPVELMKASHATPEQAIAIAKDLNVKTVVGMHWGTVRLTNEPAFEAPERFLKAGNDAGFTPNTLWAMKIGETRLINE